MNLFKSIKAKAKQITTPVPTAKEIHEELYSIHGLLYGEAEKLAANAANAKELYDLGFKSASNIGGIVKASEKVAAAREYQIEYPNNKFVDEEAVKRICEKYALYLVEASRFTAAIPQKNQKEIAAFRVKDKHISRIHSWGSMIEISNLHITHDQYGVPQVQAITIGQTPEDFIKGTNLKIIAPESQIDMKGMKKIGYQIVDEDPIVLQPVKGGYLIVAAWGDEASDEIVVNQKMN